jgi:epoxyqueuosine reductase QueG
MSDVDPNQVVPETVAETSAIVAASAANSAQVAEQAAAGAIASAQTVAAQATDAAAQSLTATEERLAAWQTTIQTQSVELADNLQALRAQTESQLKETSEQISLILKRLPPQPEVPTSPSTEGEGAREARTEAPKPEEPPPRRRAHRWT